METKNPVGRPLKFKTPQEITDKADKYFMECEATGRPITVTGLCIALDTFRDVLMQYEDERGPEFTNAVKSAKVRCERYAEEQIYIGKSAAGGIFSLKNFGWRDMQHLDHTNDGGKFEPGVDPALIAATKTYEEAKRLELLKDKP